MIRNDPGADTGQGIGGDGGTGGGMLDAFLRGAYGNVTPVYDQFGNITGFRQGFPGDSNDPGRSGGSNSRGGGGAAIPTGTAGTTGATGATAAGTAGAAAGTLGTVRGILGLAGQLAPILSSIAGDRAAGRQAAGVANQNQARAAADIFRTRMDASLKGPRQSASDAAYGDTLANIQPFSWTGANKMVGNIPVPQSSGGMGPQNFGPATRQAGQSLATLGASRVNSPSFNLPEPPTLPDLPQAGTADSILNGAGTVASILAAYNLYNQGRNGTGQPMPRTQYDPNDTNGYG